MTTAVQHRRGTTAEHATFTGLEGEVTIDTTKDTAVIHDGTLAGGYPLAKENLANVNPTTLSTIDGASTASDDKFLIWDQSALTLKSITRAELNNAMEADALANVSITGGTINGTTIGGTTPAAITGTTITATAFSGPIDGTVGATTPAAGAFTTLTASSTATLNTLASSGATLTGGSINNMAIGGSTAAAGAFTTLAASGAVTLSGGTANGVPYLNGSKVLTSGSALTFDGTHFGVGTSSLSSLAQRTIDLNAASNSALVFKAADTTFAYLYADNAANEFRMYGGSSKNLTFYANATEAMRLTSTGLGIGTSSPTNYGAGYRTVSANGTSSGVFELQANGTAQAILVADNTDLQIQALGARPIRFFTNGNQRAAIDSSGNLGLGVTPSAWSVGKAFEMRNAGNGLFTNGAGEMLVTANTYYDGAWRYGTTGAYAAQYICGNTNGTHIWKVASSSGTAGTAISFTQAMTLDASGRLGVGTTSPSNIGVTAESTGSNSVYFTANNTTGYNFIAGVAPALGYGLLGMTTNHALAFMTNNTERARIDSSGNLLVGTTSGTANAKIDFVASAAGQTFRFQATSGSYAGTMNYLVADRSASTAFDFYGAYAAGAAQFSVKGNGVIYAQNTSVQSISDQRLKENIRDATDGLKVINALRTVRFDWKAGYGNDRKNQLGFIAQEVEAVFPEAVSEWQVNKDDETAYKTVGPSAFIPVLVKAIQEQQAIIEQLKARLDAANL